MSSKIGDFSTKPLVVLGCTHLGAKTADYKMAQKYVAYAKETKAAVLMLGDNFECAVPKKGAMMFEQDLTPQEQLEKGIDLYAPIAKQVIGACSSNHSARAYKEAGLDMDRIMADRLGYLKVYNQHRGYTAIKVGNQQYRIAYAHGTGFGSNSFGNGMTLLKAFPMSDIVCTSHTHEMATVKKGFFDHDKDGKRVFRDITLINTGSLLDCPKYADEAGYAPQPKGFAIAYLGMKHREVSVNVSGII